MIGGASWSWWIGFHVVVVALVAADTLLTRGRQDSPLSQRLAWVWAVMLAIGAACFAGWIAVKQGHVPALQFVAGYAIETSLSVDNLFVFLILFQGFRVGPKGQRHVLTWGIAGAIALRALFIAAGTALLTRFHWITWVFGVLLLYAAFRLLRGSSAKDAIPEWIRKLQPVKGSLLPVILAVEFTDLLFALDSIPAVLAITRDPFIVYTSNIAAVLGLRSLYFVLAGLLDRLRYLHYGLGVLLAFVAFKILAAPWFEIPVTLSLAIIGAILAICAVVSIMQGSRE